MDDFLASSIVHNNSTVWLRHPLPDMQGYDVLPLKSEGSQLNNSVNLQCR